MKQRRHFSKSAHPTSKAFDAAVKSHNRHSANQTWQSSSSNYDESPNNSILDRTVKSAKLEPGPTAMYAQLASIMRSKVLSQEWPENFEIPTLAKLCDQYKVARVTARQATQLLVADGLLSSQRGRRTFVSYHRPHGSDEPIKSSIGGFTSEPPNYSISILEKVDDADLPDRPFIGAPVGRYVRIRKVDKESGSPYSYSETYIAKVVFDSFPDGSIEKSKLSRLILQHSIKPLTLGRERIRVAAADYQEAAYLKCAMSEPVARASRIICDEDGSIILWGEFVYKGDRFFVEHDITRFVLEPE
jgi:GntR family transcriptional regulator